MKLPAITQRNGEAPRLQSNSALMMVAGITLVALGAVWLLGKHRHHPWSGATAAIVMGIGSMAIVGTSCWLGKRPGTPSVISPTDQALPIQPLSGSLATSFVERTATDSSAHPAGGEPVPKAPPQKPALSAQPAADPRASRCLERLTAVAAEVLANPEADQKKLHKELFELYFDSFSSSLAAGQPFIWHVVTNPVWRNHFGEETPLGSLLHGVATSLLDEEGNDDSWRREEQSYVTLLSHEDWVSHPEWSPVAWYLVKHTLSRSISGGTLEEMENPHDWAQMKVALLSATRPLWCEYSHPGQPALFDTLLQWHKDAKTQTEGLPRLVGCLTALLEAMQKQAAWALPMFRQSLQRLVQRRPMMAREVQASPALAQLLQAKA